MQEIKNDEIRLIDYWRIIMRYKKSIVTIVTIASVAAVIISLILPKTYRSETVIIPVSSKGGGGLAGLASQFGGLASLAGLNVSGANDDRTKILAILKSRTLTENVIERENLMPILFEKMWDKEKGEWKTTDSDDMPNMEKAVTEMKKRVVVMDDKKGKTIKIEGEFGDRQVASDVVNAYVEELQKFIYSNAFTVAKRNRMFIEDQLEQNKRELLESGKEINEFYKTNKVSNVEARVNVPIGLKPWSKKLKVQGEASSPQKTVLAMNDAANVADEAGMLSVEPKVSLDEIDSLIAVKGELDQKIAEAKFVKNIPQQVYLTYLIMRRELLAKVNALLTTQYEMSKIEESKEDLTFQVIDKAVPAIRKYRPKRAQICIVIFMAALFFAVGLAFVREFLHHAKEAGR